MALENGIAVPATGTHKWLLAIAVLLYAVLVAPFVYRDVLGEPDLERMALGVMYGAASGLHETAGNHYNYIVSFGYYAGLYHLLPRQVLINSDALIAAINYIGFLSAVMALGMLALYTSRLFGVGAAIAICLIFAFSPMYMDLGTSGHPQLPGFALLMAGAWLLSYVTERQLRFAARLAAAAAAVALLVAAMTVRADVALAFPFMVLMGREIAFPDRYDSRAGRRSARGIARLPMGITAPRQWLHASALRLAVLVTVCLVWFAVQSSVFHETVTPQGSGYVQAFLVSFYKLQTVPRGLIVFCLCLGVATTAVLSVLPFTPAPRLLHRMQIAAIVLLALPTLLFWLPNSTPGRHLLLAYLAAAMFIGLALTRTLRASHALAICALLPATNQVIAEISHGPIERHYQWEYRLLSSRRATTSIPMGTFPLDHAAKQEAFALLRREGREFAHACAGRVLVLGEEPHFMIMSLIERDPSIQLDVLWEAGLRVVRASGALCTADFVDKQAVLRRDTARDFLQLPAYQGWPVYFQETRRNSWDRTVIPAARRFCIGDAFEPRCVGAAAPDTHHAR